MKLPSEVSDSTVAATRASPDLPLGTKTRPGLVQNWPTPSVIEPARPAPISAPRSSAALSVTTNGFAEPSSPKNGIGTARALARLPECQAGADRAGEADGADARRVDQRRAGAEAEDEVERSLGRLTTSRGSLERRERRRAGRRVGRMRLDHDGTAGRERGGRVATRDREGEGEVRAAEDADDADRRSAPGVGRAADPSVSRSRGRRSRRGTNLRTRRRRRTEVGTRCGAVRPRDAPWATRSRSSRASRVPAAWPSSSSAIARSSPARHASGRPA